MARRHQAAPQQPLFVVTVQNKDLHDQVLVLAEQADDLGLAGAFRGRGLLPAAAMAAEQVQRGIEPGQELFAGAAGLELRGLAGVAQQLILVLSQRKEVLAKDEVGLEVLG